MWQTPFSLAMSPGWEDLPGAPAGEAGFALAELAGFKDPRESLLLPLYEQVFAECGVRPRYILCIRPTLEPSPHH
jgi:hypothetical protein